MAYRKILTVQDISCVGQCSITVALPILSACGHETCILPSAVLSTHTGGFGTPHFKDMTGELDSIIAHWKTQNFQFDGIYTGYLGNTVHTEYVKRLFETMLVPGGLRIVDPAMADQGQLYSGFDMHYVQAMGSLCACADVILPNVTEACLMTGMAYREHLTEEFVAELMTELEKLAPNVVLTGIGYQPDETGVMTSCNGRRWHYIHKKIPRSFPGTGDVFASTFVGCLQQGRALEEAVRIAADFTARCIEQTWKDTDHWYGVKFEAVLPELMHTLFPDQK